MASAKLNRDYAVRVLGVGAIMIGMCLWSLYDGLVAWPQCNRRMDVVRPSLLATNLTAEAWLERNDARQTLLDETFAAQGVKAPSKLVKKISELKIPGTAQNRDAQKAAQAEQIAKTFNMPVYSDHDLKSQFILAGVTLMMGLWAFAVIALKSRKAFVADDRGLHGSGTGNQTIPYDAIQSVDWKKWDDKGIVRLELSSGLRLTLDGWHYAGIQGIVDEILAHRPDLTPRPKA